MKQKEQKEKVFADGFIFKLNEKKEFHWVVGSISIKVDQAMAFLAQNEKKGWVNLDLNIAKNGKPYVQLDTWEPKPTKKDDVFEESDDEDVPF